MIKVMTECSITCIYKVSALHCVSGKVNKKVMTTAIVCVGCLTTKKYLVEGCPGRLQHSRMVGQCNLGSKQTCSWM